MNYQKLALAGIMAAVMGGQAVAAELKTYEQRLSYTIGAQFGHQLKQEGVPLDVEAFSQAMQDAMKGVTPKLKEDEMRAVLSEFQQKQTQLAQKAGDKNKREGEAFLAENGKKPGVKTTASGLQYKVIQEGKGAKPKATDTVTVNYRGTLINGTEFDSSYKRGEPASFPVNQVIPGWQEAIPMMSKGSKWQIFIPSNLAYGPKGTGGSIGPNSTLVFEVELLDIKAK